MSPYCELSNVWHRGLSSELRSHNFCPVDFTVGKTRHSKQINARAAKEKRWVIVGFVEVGT